MEKHNICWVISDRIGLTGKRRAKCRVKVNEAYCKGCGYCIEFCPRKVFDRKVELNSKGVNLPVFARPHDCMGCSQCRLLCTDLAIKIEEVESDG